MKCFSIIFQDNDLLVINKASGLAVQGGEGVVHSLDRELSKELGSKVYLVHRLDKETSGILLVAKNPLAAAKWTNLIASKAVKKEYYALCLGYPECGGKRAEKGVLKTFVISHGKKQSAETFFEVIKSCEVELPSAEEKSGTEKDSFLPEKVTLSFLHITLGTGRMHQIRIQMAEANAPLAGDDRHGNFRLNKAVRRLGIKKLCLCSSRLTLPLEDGKSKTFEIPLPDYMEKIVSLYLS